MMRFIFGALIVLFFIPLSYAENLVFEHGQHRLSGHYLAPSNNKPTQAVLLFVHGDSALSYDAEGYYNIIWQPLREQGYAIFSWDKPGVGDSSGNWLEQSMTDRQSEVLAAVEAVQNKYHFISANTGLIGFSQAGWVLPALASNTDKIGFIVGIGFANNWIEQGRYYSKTRLRLAGADKSKIASELDANTKEIALFDRSPDYSEYLKYAGQSTMSQDRYQFVLKNYRSDASLDYSKIKVPTLLLWGEHDLNVDAKQEFNWWQNQPNRISFVTTKLIPNASHGMLKSESFNTQKFGGFIQWLKLMWLEQEAFAPEFLPTVLLWLEQHNG